jgi:hypothetical protein
VTDVIAGMAAGYIVGTIFAHPLRNWKRSFVCAIANVTPGIVIVTSSIWLILHRVEDHESNEILSAVGIVLVIVGLIIRWSHLYGWSWGNRRVNHREIAYVIGLGLSCATGSFVVIGVTILAVMARWAADCAVTSGRSEPMTQMSLSRECLYTIGVVVLLVLTLQLKGIIPIQ